jgi:hypothetical protein
VCHGLNAGGIDRLHGFNDAEKAIDLGQHALTFVWLEFKSSQVGNAGNILWGQRHGLKRGCKGRIFQA